MGINKVILNGTSVLDLSEDTATINNVANNIQFHNREGEKQNGIGYNGDVLTISPADTGTHKGLFSEVIVEPLPNGSLVPKGTLLVTKNNFIEDVAKYEKAEIRVPIPDEYIIPSGVERIEQNGEYDIKDKASVIVEVPEPSIPQEIYLEIDELPPEQQGPYEMYLETSEEAEVKPPYQIVLEAVYKDIFEALDKMGNIDYSYFYNPQELKWDKTTNGRSQYQAYSGAYIIK